MKTIKDKATRAPDSPVDEETAATPEDAARTGEGATAPQPKGSSPAAFETRRLKRVNPGQRVNGKIADRLPGTIAATPDALVQMTTKESDDRHTARGKGKKTK